MAVSRASDPILIVAGGTGGHLYPGIAVAQALAGANVRFVVRRGDLGRDILRREGFEVLEIAGQGLPRRLNSALVRFPGAFLKSWRETFALLKQQNPRFVLGMGGYLSFPVLSAAVRRHVPTLIHEQNAVPGLANRLLGRWVDRVAVSFPGTESFFPASRVSLSGLPVRMALRRSDPATARQALGLRPDVLTFFAFGGSLGAHPLNEVLLQVWKNLAATGRPFQVLHVTGLSDFPAFERIFKEAKIPGQVLAYCHDMPAAYAAADLVICRSGASTIAELEAVGRPAFLVPYPYATNDHQWFNAQVLVQAGTAEVFREKAISADLFTQRLSTYMVSPELLKEWQGRCEGTKPFLSDPPAVIIAKHILKHSAV
jgi:UDP-N-acetylglucosamine--N-acetylmuramyl-(pentapeptide) pyrophosphoryl-undecaprenol N-acetylglucosamine transferase